MEEEIGKKLRELLVKGIESEAELVYFLVQIRKLGERREVSLPTVIAMFCDWVVHPWLSNPEWGNLAMEAMEKPRGIAYEFEVQLHSHLQALDLPEPNWSAIIDFLGAVIADCPVVYYGEGWFRFEAARIPGFNEWAFSLQQLRNLPSDLPKDKRRAAAVIAKLSH